MTVEVLNNTLVSKVDGIKYLDDLFSPDSTPFVSSTTSSTSMFLSVSAIAVNGSQAVQANYHVTTL